MDSIDSNQLHKALSPYLQQHAGNPVHWQQWSPGVLAAAKAQDKPVLLSIGYSACHWCHVMAHESFEDPATAEVMNRHFINIKLDREERPDLDRIYQLAHQLMNQQGGGWPLTVFLDPRDQTPFFSGTYFPPQPRHGLPGFLQLLEGVQRFYQENSGSLPEQSRRMQAALQHLGNPAPEPAAQEYDAREILRDGVARHFDEQWGGFLGAPKFPQAAIWSALLAVSREKKEERLVRGTLDGMSCSGLFDHAGGGFFRYSVDDHWEIPHFEKMLYDNGQLLKLYADAAASYNKGDYAAVVSATADWLLAEMRTESGGFYSALDADSEGEEGKYYVWTKEEAKTLLTSQEWGLAKAAYGFSDSPNFEGRWHLTRYPQLDELPGPVGADLHRKQIILENARQKLAASRQQRIKPFRDEKILTAWNGLAATGLIEAARVLNREDYLEAADRCLDFIKANQWDGEKLLSCYKGGQSYETGHLDDYAFVAEAVLHRLQSVWDDDLYSWLLAIKSRLMEDFADPAQGGFYFTALEREDLLIRHRVLADEAIPSGNAVALKVLLALAYLDSDWKLLDFVEKSISAWPDTVKRQPQSHATLLALKTWLDEGVELVVIRGTAEPAQIWSREARRGYHPARFIFAIPTQSAWDQREKRVPRDAQVCAYYCRARQCLPVFTNQRDLISALDEGSLG